MHPISATESLILPAGFSGVTVWRGKHGVRVHALAGRGKKKPARGRFLAEPYPLFSWGRGFAGDPQRCKTRQAVQACLGFYALRLNPQKQRRARREF
ncbi:MAG: hypothetical protein ACO22V_07910 [Hylemonella sp.]